MYISCKCFVLGNVVVKGCLDSKSCISSLNQVYKFEC